MIGALDTRHHLARNRLAATSAVFNPKCDEIGRKLGAGEPVRAASMARPRTSVARAKRRPQVPMMQDRRASLF